MAPGQLADYLDALGQDLSDGVFDFEGNQLEIGETVDFSILHTASGKAAVEGVQITFPFGEEIPREQPEAARRMVYKRESEFVSMAEVGKLLERFGKEIQDKGSISVGGTGFAVSGRGTLEIKSSEGRRNSVEISISPGRAQPPGQKGFYVPYERRSQGWTPADLAAIVAAVGETLAGTGVFVLEDDSVALEGTASVERRLVERSRPGRRPHTFYLNIGFGQEDLAIPEEEYSEELGAQEELARAETKDVDRAGLASVLGSLSGDLKAGRVRVGDKEFAVGEDVDFRVKHTSSTDGSSNRIQIAFSFGERTPRADRTPRRAYSRESPEMPMRDIGELFQRIGTGILSDGTFNIGGVEFRAGEMANMEIAAIEGRRRHTLEIELSYTEPEGEQNDLRVPQSD